MSRFHSLSLCVVVGVALSGCGPLPNPPLPVRVDDETQKTITASWDKALTPVDRFDGQSLLDVLLTTTAYQHGVDKLEFRSEKALSDGTVVMEMHFDRGAPDRDRFTVTVSDRLGKVLRQEQYNREQIETTASELTSGLAELRKKCSQGTATPLEQQRLAALEARLARVASVWPHPAVKQ